MKRPLYVIIERQLYLFPVRWQLEYHLTRLALKVYWKTRHQGGVAVFGKGAIAYGCEEKIEEFKV